MEDSLGKNHREPELVQSRIEHMLSRITLLHRPYTHFQLPSLEGDRILRCAAGPDAEKCDMVVYDESHHIFCLPPEVAWRSTSVRFLSSHLLLGVLASRCYWECVQRLGNELDATPKPIGRAPTALVRRVAVCFGGPDLRTLSRAQNPKSLNPKPSS